MYTLKRKSSNSNHGSRPLDVKKVEDVGRSSFEMISFPFCLFAPHCFQVERENECTKKERKVFNCLIKDSKLMLECASECVLGDEVNHSFVQ